MLPWHRGVYHPILASRYCPLLRHEVSQDISLRASYLEQVCLQRRGQAHRLQVAVLLDAARVPRKDDSVGCRRPKRLHDKRRDQLRRQQAARTAGLRGFDLRPNVRPMPLLQLQQRSHAHDPPSQAVCEHAAEDCRFRGRRADDGDDAWERRHSTESSCLL